MIWTRRFQLICSLSCLWALLSHWQPQGSRHSDHPSRENLLEGARRWTPPVATSSGSAAASRLRQQCPPTSAYSRRARLGPSCPAGDLFSRRHPGLARTLSELGCAQRRFLPKPPHPLFFWSQTCMLFGDSFWLLPASLMAQIVKCLSAMQETRVQSLGWEDPLEQEMATTSVFLPGKFHGWRCLVGYRLPWGCKESDATEQLHFTFTFVFP